MIYMITWLFSLSISMLISKEAAHIHNHIASSTPHYKNSHITSLSQSLATSISTASNTPIHAHNHTAHQASIKRHCLLNDGACSVRFISPDGASILATISATPRNIIAMEAVLFHIEGANLSNLSGVITGLNMHMGDVLVRFHKINDSLYEGRAIMAQCTEHRMQYRMQLRSEAYLAEVDFDVINP